MEDSDFITEDDGIDDAVYVIESFGDLKKLTCILFSSDSLSSAVVSCLFLVDNCAIDPVVSSNDLLSADIANDIVCASLDGA